MPLYLCHHAGAEVSFTFATALRGWAVGVCPPADGGKQFARTNDGGFTWTQLDSLPATGRVVFTDARHGWLAGSGWKDVLYETSDAGDTWKPRTLPAPDGYADADRYYGLPTFLDAEGFMVVAFVRGETADFAIYHTTNEGRTWALITVRKAGAGARGASFPGTWTIPFDATRSAWWLCAPEPPAEIMLTLDRGRTWRPVKPPTDGYIRQVEAVDGRHAWIVVNGGLYSTDDSGATWRELRPN